MNKNILGYIMTQPQTANDIPIYLAAKRFASQRISSGTWGGVVIKMDDKRGGIEYDIDTGIFTLEGGNTYRVTAQVGWVAGTPEFYAFGVFNVDTGTQIGPLAEALPPNRDTCNASGGVLDVIFAPPQAGKYHLKMAPNVSASSRSYVNCDCTFLNIGSEH
jgi:hypothetical protein